MPETAEQFVQRCGSIVANGISTISLNLGVELGLFRAMAERGAKPATAQEIADAAGCKERYVREWLNACATSDLVEIDDAGEHYWLSEARCQAVLSPAFREAMANGPFLEMFATIYPKVAECFKKDGPAGISYDSYSTFGPKMEAFTQHVMVNKVESHVVPLLSQAWRDKLENGGIEVLDIACGTGGTTCKWAQLFPKCKFVGFDFGVKAIAVAAQRATSLALTNVEFVAHDATALPDAWTGRFHMAMVTDALHDMARPDLALRQVHRVLRPDALLLVHDIDADSNPACNRSNAAVSSFYVASYCHCTPVSLYFDGGLGLGTCWGRQRAKKLVEEGGFRVEKQGSDGPPYLQYMHAYRV